MNTRHPGNVSSCWPAIRRMFLIVAVLSAAQLMGSTALSAAAGRSGVVVWSERTAPKEVYPEDINGGIAKVLQGIYQYSNGKTELARVGYCWTIGRGKVFYLQLGHETFTELDHPEVCRVIRNGVRWAASKRQTD